MQGQQSGKNRLIETRSMEEEISAVLSDPSLYNNRELSLLEFNQRILEEAQDPEQPDPRALEIPLYCRLQS